MSKFSLIDLTNLIKKYSYDVLPTEAKEIYSETIFLRNRDNLLIITPTTKNSFIFWSNNTNWDLHDCFYNPLLKRNKIYITISSDLTKTIFIQNDGVFDSKSNYIFNIKDKTLKNIAFLTNNIHHICINYNIRYECKRAIIYDAELINNIPPNLLTFNMCKRSLSFNGNGIKFIINNDFYKKLSKIKQKELINIAINKNGNAISCVPREFINKKLLMDAIYSYPNSILIETIPAKLKTKILWELAIILNSDLFVYAPKTFINKKMIFKCFDNNKKIIKYIKNNLPYYKKFAFIAIKTDTYLIRYIDKELPYYEELCKLAIKNNPDVIRYIDNTYYNYYNLCIYSLNYCGLAINDINRHIVDYNLCKIAIQQNPLAIQYIINNYNGLLKNELCELACSKNGLILEIIPKKFKTEKLCKMAIKQNPLAKKYTI